MYEIIDHDAIKEEGNNILEITYNIQKTITNIFEPIQELEQLVIAGNRPHT